MQAQKGRIPFYPSLYKQYRIGRDDLEAFTGVPAPCMPRESATGQRRREASTIVQVDAISFDTMTKLTTTLSAITQGRDEGRPQLSINTAYDAERASLKVIIVGGLEDTAELLNLTARLVGRTT